MSSKEVATVLEKLFKEREELDTKMKDLEKADPQSRFSGKYLELQQQFQSVDARIDRAMNWYSVHVLENLEGETRTLGRLTKILIGLTGGLVALTIVLAIFTWLLVTKLP
jgi:hypothetical protein